MEISDQKLSDFYHSHSLPETSVDRILAMGIAERKRRRPIPIWMGVAAAIVVILLGSFLIPRGPTLEALVAASVLKNHFKQSAPTIYSSSFQEIEKGLPQFQFAFAPTREDELAKFSVVGGRACSIYSEPAVQINLKDPDGQGCTLYVAPLSEQLAQVETGTYQQGESSVQIWHDAGRIFALAR